MWRTWQPAKNFDQVINWLGMAKALDPQDQEGSQTLLGEIKLLRGHMFGLNDSIKEAKTQVKKLLKKPAALQDAA